MSRQDSFEPVRICCACGSTATRGQVIDGEPNILGISMLIYRRGHERELGYARKVNICEPCFVSVLAGSIWGESSGSKKFTAAIKESLCARYNAMLEAEKA